MNRRTDRDAPGDWVRTVLREGAGAAGEPSLAAAGAAAFDTSGPAFGDAGWREAWAALELPPAAGAPAGFASRIALAWAAERARAESPLLGAGWMRAAAAAALLAGVALGTGLSVGTDSSASAEDSWKPTTLSEEYLSAIATPDAALAAPGVAVPTPDVPLTSGADEP